ncbi:Replicative DNA helicase [Rubripirellula tenax]|uniref:Replicative DNA helicase n=1 Tax=Rubripirellula tenax TaxID=2528015 RepID=A0A5C6FHG3_9BACT|nr:DnaB-like helicase C-terminal domain-containing protein [Rubripirellula tenax]TWU59069.1 Replicative DNA helicase [Rubripirellula tenax]
MSAGNYILCEQLFNDWKDDVLHGEPPRFFDVGMGANGFRLCPGTVTLLGGSPGMGKTAFVMQCVVTALVNAPSLSACIANVEMPPERLLERQLSRLSDLPLDGIQRRTLDAVQKGQLEPALGLLSGVADRLVFVQSPMTIDNVAAAADSISAELIVLDYIQRIRPVGSHDDKRGSVDATMDSIRHFAAAGYCVVAVAAVGRTKDARGRSSYAGDGLSLASFRESSELEYGADDAYLIVPTEDDESGALEIGVTLRHLKSRYGKPTDIELAFNRSRQSFWPQPVDSFVASGPRRGPVRGLWRDS